ncbi:hypothetical protein ABE021_01760 [Sporosarcina gallistercoris]|uniref:hypothetical protein n=1 Tax=Sporosarcina gallistercoris TaxID=2762245 RepID=UPI003D275D65
MILPDTDQPEALKKAVRIRVRVEGETGLGQYFGEYRGSDFLPGDTEGSLQSNAE